MYLAGNIHAMLQMETNDVPHTAAAQLFRANNIPLTDEQYRVVANALPVLQSGRLPHKQVAALIAGQKQLSDAFAALIPQT
jgi:hypothetical protein